MIKKFRKKPVVVEALKWELDFNRAVEMSKFMGNKFRLKEFDISKLIVPTVAGDTTANEGDWIVKVANEEFYPCKPDIFEKTYEEIK